jgi:hypothetical protein
MNSVGLCLLNRGTASLTGWHNDKATSESAFFFARSVNANFELETSSVYDSTKYSRACMSARIVNMYLNYNILVNILRGIQPPMA